MTERTIPKADMDAAIAAAEEKYPDLPKGLLAKMAQVESRYGERLSNPSGARGPWQFMPKTGPQYGLMTEEDRMDPYKSADAAARLLLNNKKDLENRIGRTVTNGELYLAHQQGAAGAARLLKDPTRNAAETVGAERVRQNLPKAQQANYAKLTTGDFAKLWTSKFDDEAPAPGAPPAKKSEPRAASSLGALPGVTPTADFYSYNPNSLARLEQGSKTLAQRTAAPVAPPALAELSTVPVEKGSISQLITPTPAEPGAAPTPKPPRSTAILQGLSTVDKIARRNAMTAQTVEGVEPTRVAPSGIVGDFTAGVDAGMAGMEGDREYFGAIIDTLMGNEEGAKSHLMNADISSQQAAQALSGLPSFEDFMKAPTLDGFISQMASSTGQVAPSALESMAWAIGTGGTFAIGKAGLSAGSKMVVNTLVKDMLTKKVKGEVLDAAEDKVLDAMFKNFKRGALAGAFGQEFVMGSGGAFQEFDEAGVALDSDRAVQALLWGAPQAAIGAGGEAFIVKTLGELALKKSTRNAKDSVLKRFAADVLGASAKAGAIEGGTEFAQEGLSVAQRVSVDPTYSQEERELRLAQAAFSGFFGGGLFGGGAAIPASGAAAARRSTIGEKIVKKANEFLQDASDARVETEVNQDTKNIDDGVITGDTAPESADVLFSQFREMMDPKHPRKAVWLAASQDFGMEIPDNKVVAQEQTEDAYRGSMIYAGRVPDKGVIVSPDRAVVDQVIHTSMIGGDVDAAIGEALGMGGPKGDQVIRVKKDGVVTHEQTFNEADRAAAEASAAAMANGDPNAVIDQPTIETALEERAQAVAAEKESALVDSAVTDFMSVPDKAQTAVPKEEAAAIGDMFRRELDPEAIKADIEKEAAKANAPLERVYDAEGNEFVTTPENERRNEDGSVEVQVKRFGKIDSWLAGPKELLGSDNPAAPDAVLSTGEQVANISTPVLIKRAAKLRVQSREYSAEQAVHRRDFTRIRAELGRRDVEISPVNRGDQTVIPLTPEIRKRATNLLKILEPHVQYRSLVGDVYDDAVDKFGADKVVASDLDRALLNLELSLAWPRHKSPGDDVITAMRDLVQLRAELAPSIIERDSATTEAASIEKLKETASKLSKPEKRAVWELLKRLAKANQGVFPAIVKSSSTNPNALGSFDSLNNFLGFKPATGKDGVVIPTALVVMHELGHWSYYNTLSPADRVEFWSIMENYETDSGVNEGKLNRALAGSTEFGGNSRVSPQEFFAQQFSYWAAQKMGLTKEQVVDTKSEEYDGKTFREQLNQFFSKYVKELLRVVEDFFGRNKVDPEMAALFDRVFGAEQIDSSKDTESITQDMIQTRDMTVENHSQPTEPFLGKAVRPAPYHALSDPENSLTERKYRDELYKRVTDGDLTVEQVPLKGLVPTQTGISERFRDLPARKKLPLIVKFKGVSYIEDGHHRLAAAAERGDATVEARVVDLDQKPEIKTRDMTVDDSGDTTADNETTSEADVTDIEQELAARYEEIDNQHAEVIDTFKPHKTVEDGKTDKFGQEVVSDRDKNFFNKFTDMIQNLPPILWDMIPNYEEFEPIMPMALLDKLISEMEFNPESVYAIRQNDMGDLELVKRDNSTDPETIETRKAVGEVLKMIKGWSKNPAKTGVLFKIGGKLDRGFHEGYNKKTRKRETLPGSLSKFYLRKRKAEGPGASSSISARAAVGAIDGKTDLLNMSGVPSVGGEGLGSQAFHRIAQAGVALNAKINRGLDGPKYTPLQKYRLGLETMLGALIEAGYDLVYEPGEGRPLVPVTNFKRLEGDARFEVASIIAGKPYTLGEMFGGKLPFDKPKADFDPSTMGTQLQDSTEQTTRSVSSREELGRSQSTAQQADVVVDYPRVAPANRAVADLVSKKGVPNPNNPINVSITPGGERTVTRVEQGTERRIAQGETRQTAVDQNEQRALSDAIQKKKGGFDTELEQSRAENAARRADVKATVKAMVEEAIANGETRTLAYDVENFLGDLPEDVTFTARKVNGEYVVTINSPRFPDMKAESKKLRWAIIRAHELVKGMSESQPIRYDRIGLEDAFHSTLDSQETARSDGTTDPKIPEIDGVRAPKDQTSLKQIGDTSKNANDVKVLGKLGTMTSKVLGAATKKFLFRKPVIVTTLDSLKANFDKLVGKGGELEGFSAPLAETIARMELQDASSPYGRVLMGNKNVIVLRDTPETLINPKNVTEEVFNPDDALVGSVLAHELGHIIFNQEYDLIDRKENKLQLWEAFQRFKSEMGVVPTDYTYTEEQVAKELARRKTNAAKSFAARETTIDADGKEETLAQWEKANRATRQEVIQDYNKKTFEEWFADQVMAYVYNENKPVKNMKDGFFKRLATAFRDFWHEINSFLGGRMKEATEKGVNAATGKTEIKWRFSDFMEQVVARHDALRSTNREVPMASRIMIREMTNNIASRLPKRAANRFNSVAKKIMSTGSLGNVMHKIQNLVQASTDFMKLSEHGEGGKALSEFFGTLSQNVGQLGWNKRKLFEENRLNNRFAAILGITEKSKPEEWESPRVTAILNEAEDNTIDYANLTTPEAKAIRDLFTEIYDKYLTIPGTNKQWVETGRLKNYGGPRMFNAEKIAKNKTQFINWLLAHPTWRNRPDAQAAAEAVFSRITMHQGDIVANLTTEVDTDIANGVFPNTPIARASELFRRSMVDRAVATVRNKVFDGARKGAGYSMSDLLNKMKADYPVPPANARMSRAERKARQALHRASATTEAEMEAALKTFWMSMTQALRLTPGMDPALERTLKQIETRELRNAIPGDPNGWLHPQGLAISQYFHFVTRIVEYEKMGGYDYVSKQLAKVPEAYRHEVDAAIMANLGKFSEYMSPKWRLFNSVAAVWTVFTTLLFATLTSVTDLAGVAVRSKDFASLNTYFNGLRQTLSNKDWSDLARSVGVVTFRSQDHAMVGLGELDYANRASRSIMNGFFRYTGLEFFTKFSRTFATGMGREFLINTAAKADFGPREARYLAELNLTRADVQQWQADGERFDTVAGEKVRDAIARFADEAIIRPDASQRPTWASNPYFATVWQLKSYYYGFGKTVMGGMGREIQNRWSETRDFKDAAGPMLLMALTIIPLTMLGLHSREWLKWLFQLALPGVPETAFKTSEMDGGEYMWEIFQRSGVLGPFALGLNTMEAFQFEGIAAPFTANIPMADLFDDMIFDGDLTRPVPVLNNIK